MPILGSCHGLSTHPGGVSARVHPAGTCATAWCLTCPWPLIGPTHDASSSVGLLQRDIIFPQKHYGIYMAERWCPSPIERFSFVHPGAFLYPNESAFLAPSHNNPLTLFHPPLSLLFFDFEPLQKAMIAAIFSTTLLPFSFLLRLCSSDSPPL